MDPSIAELEESNMDLEKAVSFFHITDEEYDVLGSLLDQSMRGSRARPWLERASNVDAVPINKVQAAMLRAPYEKMPLYINDYYKPIAIIARWRLKIGR